MSNDYFNHTSPLSRHTLARSTAINTFMTAIAAGFDKLPAELVLNQGRVNFASDGGAANAYTATMPKTWTSYVNGATVLLEIGAGNTNTGACTLNVDGLGARAIKTFAGADPAASDLEAGKTYHLVYDASASQFKMLSYASQDTVNIATVADNITNVNTVAGISGNVTTVAGINANVTTVAGISANVTTVAGVAANVTTVAGISSDVTTVAADSVDIGTVAGISADIQTLADIEDGTSATNAISTVASISANVTTVAADGVDIGTVAGISADVSTVAGISANVTTVANDGTDIGTVAGLSADIQTLADIEDGTTATNAISTVAGISANVTTVANDGTDIGTVAGISGNVTTVAGISANVTTVAGISGNVTTVAGDSAAIGTVAGISGNITTAAGISADITTVAGVSANVTTVATDITNVNTVATNIADVNTFANRYRIASSAPATSLDVGDLYFNTSNNQLYVYDGAAWSAAAFDTSGALIAVNNLSEIVDPAAARGNLLLGTAATAATGDFATAAQGANADTAFGWGDHSLAGYLTTVSSHTHPLSEVSDWPGAVSATEVGYLNGVTSAIQTQLNTKAPLASPALTGNPTAPTQTAGDNSTKIATTAYVDAAGGGGFVPISKTTVSGSPSAVDIELPSGYEQYMMLLDIVEPVTDGQPFHLRASNDGGSTFITGSFSHEWEVIQVKVVSGAPTVSGRASNNDNEIVLADNVGVNGYERIDFAKIIIYQPKTGTRAHVEWTIRYRDSSNAVYFESGSGAITSSTTNLTDLRFLFNSGNVSTGIFHLFGIVDGDA
jgi:hypothetical protein